MHRMGVGKGNGTRRIPRSWERRITSCQSGREIQDVDRGTALLDTKNKHGEAFQGASCTMSFQSPSNSAMKPTISGVCHPPSSVSLWWRRTTTYETIDWWKGFSSGATFGYTSSPISRFRKRSKVEAMVTILPPNNPWLQFSSFFFLMSAMWSDLIMVRGCLMMAYVNILINVLTGRPSSGHWIGDTSELALDTLLWAATTLLFHGIAFSRLVRDEVYHVFAKLESDDDKAMFRMFNRTAGMHLLEFTQVRELGEWRRYKRGEVLTTHDQSLSRAFLVVEGVVEASLTKLGDTKPFKKLLFLSGHVFNLYVFNIFGVRIGFMDGTMYTVAQTDCLVFTWSLNSLDVLANMRPPAVAIAMRNFLLYEVCRSFNELEGHPIRDSEGRVEDLEQLLSGSGRARDFRLWDYTEIQNRDLENRHIFKRAFMWLTKRFRPIPACGIQHLVTVPSYGMKFNLRGYMLALEEALMSEQEASRTGILTRARVVDLHRQHHSQQE